MMGTLIDYWYYTDDDQYNDLVTQALLFQVGDNDDYMPQNQTLTEGNDDQGFWGLAVMSAAEYNFPNPPKDKPQWLGLAQAVFNTQAARWDNENCGGGLRWQIFTWNNGYDYKNSISQACFFALGARLALYTGNRTYSDWADKTWDWMIDIKLINNQTWGIYDGVPIEGQCMTITPWQFTYNAGGFILGAAAMYNLTESQVWKDRLDNLIAGAMVFFVGEEKNIMAEASCETVNRCDLDEQSFKAYLSRWLAAITKWAPDTADTVLPLLRASAVAAAAQCTGGDNKEMCGLRWDLKGKWDGTTGVGQQMAALEVVLSCMIQDRKPAHTANTGGTSVGNPGGGGSDIGRPGNATTTYDPLAKSDMAGAGILTALLLLGLVAGVAWILHDETSDKTVAQQMKGTPQHVKLLFTGGAPAGRLRRRRDSSMGNVSEKSRGSAAAGVAVDASSNSTLGSEIQRPMSVMHVRSSEISTRPRRLSNMPLGWPHNPSLRGSTLIEPAGAPRPDSFRRDSPALTGDERQPSIYSDAIEEEGPVSPLVEHNGEPIVKQLEETSGDNVQHEPVQREDTPETVEHAEK